jgi:hypothetical protein
VSNEQGLPSLDDLFKDAFADDESAEPAVEQVAPPATEPVQEEEQSEEVIPAKLSDLVGQAPQAPAPTVDAATPIQLPNGETKTLQELIDGNMMRADYTQKTQALATERQSFEAANELFQMLQSDPQGTVLSLAQKLGLNIDGVELQDPKDVSRVLKSDEDKIAEIAARKAQEEFAKYRQSDPAIKQYEAQESLNKAYREIDRIAQTYGETFDQDDRDALILMAIENNQPNLEYIYLKAKSVLNSKQAEAERVRTASTRKTAGTPGTTPADAVKVRPKTIQEAFELAQIQLATT